MMKPASQRLLYLDWVRGLAALVMLQGHVFQSFLRNDLREAGPYVMSQFAGGMPPAIFLFLLGVTFAAAVPLISSLYWPGVPALIRNYVIPDRNFFGFFPWAAFVAFGMSAGSILRILKSEEVAPAMQWFGWGGLALAFSAYTISN